MGKLETVKVYSPIWDPNIRKELVHSPIWAECYHEDENRPAKIVNIYYIKFDGLKPVQVVKIIKAEDQ